MKKMNAIMYSTLRGIIEASNALNIQREDVVNLLFQNNNFILIYYTKD